ncbi:Elongator complex protein 1 [Podosphaera aphanis]|nr:Elongator complex protein 1 [Podosphaera aphanis]
MKNLRSTHFEKWESGDDGDTRFISSAAWDLANDSIICSIGPSENKPKHGDVTENLSTHACIASWDTPFPNPDVAPDEVLGLHYFGDSATACLVMAGGDIVIVNEGSCSAEDRIEIVGSVDEGITGAKWSLDEELLVISTKASTFIIMSRNFEVVMNATMKPEDLDLSTHVSVGWGKKETQFQGRGAKALKDPTMPEKIETGILSPNDDSRVSISWRGDGAFFAISSIENQRRAIRIYSRDGVLDSISEPVDGLEGALSWRPAGNLIASIQRLEDHVKVVFFERNGLRHGQFSLRLTPAQFQLKNQLLKLHWNSDSTVLAVIMADCIQLWTMSNYHWYLKQEISNNDPVSTFPLVWHTEKPLRFIMTSNRSITDVEHVSIVARAPITSNQDRGTVAVIDGKTVKITPFRLANVPPPMSLHEVEVDSNIVDVTFNCDASILAILHQKGISIFSLDDATASGCGPLLMGEYIFPIPDTPSPKFQQITMANGDEFFVLHKSGVVGIISSYRFHKGTRKIEMFDSKSTVTTLPANVVTLSNFLADETAFNYFQDTNGNLFNLKYEKNPTLICKFPFYLPWVELTSHKNTIIAFGVSNNGHLYANSRLLVKNCTSFLLTPTHLIFTTTTKMLKFVHIRDPENLQLPLDDLEIDERCRSIERGSRLITAMPTTLNLVLQMPRGNLETIYPRAMVLAGIRRLIEEKNYKKAFAHCRMQRVDMNLLYDHAPQQFLANIELFVHQVKKTTYLDLFLSSLREEDVNQSIYKEVEKSSLHMDEISMNNSIANANMSDLNRKSSKVNRICDAFLKVFGSRMAENLQNVITANVCKSPPALDDGLLVISRLMKDSSDMVEKAVEHICFLADVNQLYNNALGLYNLDLALLVAQQSQKDPREYLPFLQNLQEQGLLRRQFMIDDHLGRHIKALTHLHALEAFTELQAYTKKHSLYSTALTLYRYNPTQHATLTSLQANYLESKSDFSAAALAYESLSNYPKATSCYLSSGPSYWRQALYCALSQSPPVSGSALVDLATSLHDGLIEGKEYHAAATIQLEYLSSTSAACQAFCKGYFFADAFHLSILKQEPMLVSTVIEPCLVEAFAQSTELLADFKAQLLAQVPRIRELRLKALENPLALFEGERIGADANIPDDISVAASSHLSTSRSLFTRYTGKDGSVGTVGTGVSRATSKNRKREERKRARGKKGSIYEEEYLVNSVERLIKRLETIREDVRRLVEGLIRRGMWERARSIEGALEEVVAMGRSIIAEVFQAEDVHAKDSEPILGSENEQYRVVGGDAVLKDCIEAASKRKEPPVISPFKKMTLLS